MASLWDILLRGDERGPSPLDYSNDYLASLEQKVVKGLGLSDVFGYADRRPVEMGYRGESRGEADAMRHLMLAGEMQRTHPMLAGPLLWGHEYVTNVMQGQREDDREMDVFNNALGREIGRTAKSREEVEQRAQATMKAGRARTLPVFDRNGREEY